ncbi:MAG TPA: STAS/SEC14 domain-containing protein [Patescibacteria group bacterium]|nr:STAS/SEC14 domain-containing protein [Patescibacteria group bacterium]
MKPKKPAKKSTSPTARIHPASKGNILCFELDGLVTQKDHKKCVVDSLRKTIKKYGEYRVVMIYKPTLKGWEPDAAEQNLEIVLECMPYCKKAAYVNPPKKKIYQMKMTESLIHFDIRYFDTRDLDKALKWIKAA